MEGDNMFKYDTLFEWTTQKASYSLKIAFISTHLVKRSHPDCHFDAVLSVHVRHLGPHGAGVCPGAKQTGLRPHKVPGFHCVELHDDSNTAATECPGDALFLKGPDKMKRLWVKGQWIVIIKDKLDEMCPR